MLKSRLLALAATLLLLTATGARASLENPTSATPGGAALLASELFAVAQPQVAPDEAWVRIDLNRRELAVFRGERRLLTIPYLAIGNAGAKRLRLQGSSQTPIGKFRIDRINRESRFELFFGFDYPTPMIAHEAWRSGLLSDRDYREYQRYRRQYGTSPANTPLGGYIGIHGLGHRPATIHRVMDWTEGCIAVTNTEIQALDRFLDIGTLVVIQGGQPADFTTAIGTRGIAQGR